MNNYQTKLYTDLLQLVADSEAFYYTDFPLDGRIYRIFNYRLCSYTEFCRPAAEECRGIMFEVVGDKAVRLASHPMEKFYNLYENPKTTNLDLTKIKDIELKADGSLISTFLHNGELRLKSKGSLFSDQATDALNWLRLPENKKFHDDVAAIARMQGTVNMEWCAPHNRIVIGYTEPQLVVLNIRRNEDGEYEDYCKIDDHTFPELLKRYTPVLQIEDPVQFVADIPNMTDVEGYVVRLEDGMRVKIKTAWYLTQHRAKNSINSDRRLFESVLAEATDDLRTLFHDDPLVIARIEWMEGKVDKLYNSLVDKVERFYERNKDKERKDYAILGQEELSRMEFGLAMRRYLGDTIDYKSFISSKWKHFGILDQRSDEENNE